MNAPLVCLDTSVWIAFLRGDALKSSSTQIELKQEVFQLIDDDRIALIAPVKLEIAMGLKKKDIPILKNTFEAFQETVPDTDDYRSSYEAAKILREKGFTVSAMDLLIAITCHRRNFLLWSLDRDFLAIEKAKFVNLYSHPI